MRRAFRVLAYLWAFPATAMGLVLVLATVCTGGSVRFLNGVVEAHGGLARWMLHRQGGAAAAFGHVILGRNQECLDRSRAHEMVHIRQFERWGLLLFPAYFIAGCLARRRGLDPHLDNPFEREAYGRGDDQGAH